MATEYIFVGFKGLALKTDEDIMPVASTGLIREEEGAAPAGGRIMSSLAAAGGLVGEGGIAGQGGGLAG